jgi:hypothetical protein
MFDGGFAQQHILHADEEHGSMAVRVCDAGMHWVQARRERPDPAEMAPLLV